MGAYQPNTFPNEQIHCIVPPIGSVGGLYISSIHAAKDTALLQTLGIKAVLTSAYQASDLKYDPNIVPFHLVIEGRDDYLFNIYDYFDQSVNWIMQQMRVTNVLVHCMGGRSRSASLVLAYLIREKGMSYVDALSYAKGIRSLIRPNYGFQGQLQQYQNVCRAQRESRSIGSGVVTGRLSGNLNMTTQPIVYRAF